MTSGSTRARLVDVTDELVGVVELVRHFKLPSLMTVTRWVRADCPHVILGKRRFFRLPAVINWLAEKGYKPQELQAGKGLLAARKRGKKAKWRKGTMKPVGEQQPRGSVAHKGRREQARGR